LAFAPALRLSIFALKFAIADLIESSHRWAILDFHFWIFDFRISIVAFRSEICDFKFAISELTQLTHSPTRTADNRCGGVFYERGCQEKILLR
jgi:hypothetical protein